MNHASPVELRKALEAANAMAKSGINFIAIPVLDDADHISLALESMKRLERLAKEAEQNEQP